jgi:hypothetical protein
MKNIKIFNDFLEDIILENIKNDETLFMLSKDLIEVLKNIKHPIAQKLLFTNQNEYKKQSLIDIVDNEYDVFYFVNSNKIIEYIESKENLNNNFILHYINKYKDDINNKYKSKIKITKLINKLYPDRFKLNGDSGNDIESFISEYKSFFAFDDSLFKVVKGKDIIYWYNEEHYNDINLYSPLHKSCMKYKSCSDYINFYAINSNKVSLLIKYSDETKKNIDGRTLLWKIDLINGEKTDLYFMDRIYYNNEQVFNEFIAYAKHYKICYKQKQNADQYLDLIIPEKGVINNVILEIHDIKYDKNNLLFPYLDTLYKYNPSEKILTNNSTGKNGFVPLEETNGKTRIKYSKKYDEIFINNDDWVYSEYIDDFIKREDAVRVAVDNIWLDKDNIPDDYIYSNYSQSYIKKSDSEYVKYLKDYIHQNFINSSFLYSDFFDDYINKNDSVYSFKLEDNIFKDQAIKVYIDSEQKNFYYTLEDDPMEDFYKYKDNYYSDTVNKKDIK